MLLKAFSFYWIKIKFKHYFFISISIYNKRIKTQIYLLFMVLWTPYKYFAGLYKVYQIRTWGMTSFGEIWTYFLFIPPTFFGGVYIGTTLFVHISHEHNSSLINKFCYSWNSCSILLRMYLKDHPNSREIIVYEGLGLVIWLIVLVFQTV